MRARFLLLSATCAVALLVGGQQALASPPANDFFSSAQAVSSLPFSDSGDLNGTTTEPGEPQVCNFMNQTVWYSVSSATTAFRLNLNGSDPGVTANVYRSFGGGIGSLNFTGCIGAGGSMNVTVPAGSTVYIQAGSFFFGGAHLQLGMDAIPPPANDDFANATQITSLPFANTVDGTAATLESGEPGATSCGSVGHTVWYAYTASQTQTLFANGNSFGNTMIGVFTGASLGSLTEVSCGVYRDLFRAVAGRTYWIQVGVFDGQDGGVQTFSLDVAPTPALSIFWNPPDPSSFDTVQFSGGVFDPAGGTIGSQHWEFGDGSTAEGCCPTHRYTADGQYTARMTVTMTDGRVATATAAVNVKTHDVAITKLVVPQAASSGQTRAITVSVTNKRYPETVQVQLAKSVPGGWLTIGTLTLAVPANKTVDFKFSYVFTPDDAAVGKVSFQASAFLVSARDALPADNVVTALPTKVSK
jgi:hypothetical protein